MLILLTGATGYLGGAIARELLRFPVRLRMLVREPARLKLPASAAAEVVRGDLVSVDLTPLLQNVDAVCHAAGLAHTYGGGLERFRRENVETTRRLAVASEQARVGRFLLVSSLSAYTAEAANGPPTSACGAYAWSKLAAEQEAQAAFGGDLRRLVILRLAAIYGPDAPGNVTRLIGAIVRRRFVLVGNGENRKCLLHREDAASAACLALMAPAPPPRGVFDVTEPPSSMGEIVRSTSRASRRTVPCLPFPKALLRGARTLVARLPEPGPKIAHTLDRFTAEEIYSSQRFSDWTGWRPRHEFAAAVLGLVPPATADEARE